MRRAGREARERLGAADLVSQDLLSQDLVIGMLRDLEKHLWMFKLPTRWSATRSTVTGVHHRRDAGHYGRR